MTACATLADSVTLNLSFTCLLHNIKVMRYMQIAGSRTASTVDYKTRGQRDREKEENRRLTQFERAGTEKYLHSKRSAEDDERLEKKIDSMLHE